MSKRHIVIILGAHSPDTLAVEFAARKLRAERKPDLDIDIGYAVTRLPAAEDLPERLMRPGIVDLTTVDGWIDLWLWLDNAEPNDAGLRYVALDDDFVRLRKAAQSGEHEWTADTEVYLFGCHPTAKLPDGEYVQTREEMLRLLAEAAGEGEE